MDINELVFDDNFCMSRVKINGQIDGVELYLDDSLMAIEETLQDNYKTRIVNFINSSSVWLPIARQRIIDDLGNDNKLRLLCIFIHFEQDSKYSLFGLQFHHADEVEHGCGVLMDGDTFEILDYGDAHDAICPAREFTKRG